MSKTSHDTCARRGRLKWPLPCDAVPLVAIVGASSAGKTWLARQLQKRLGKETAVLGLDSFYRDRSHLSPARRAQLNFDHPRSIDWELFDRVLNRCRAGLPVEVPRYDFTSHSRQGESDFWRRKRLILVEGLWLLRRPSLRRQFAVSIFIDCAPALQLRRRLERDVAERGRTERAVREQYRRCVRPMFERYVAPQARRANIVVRTPIGMEELDKLAQRVGEVLT